MKQTTSKEIKTSIILYCKQIGLHADEKGYLKSNKENLIYDFNNWLEIEKELSSGQGNELTEKFNALHSSSALCVNNFAPIKENFKSFSFLGYDDFEEAEFEKKLSTNISTPNLDFWLKNKKTIIGIESKYFEYLTPKKPNTNLQKYIDRFDELDYLPKEFVALLKLYNNTRTKYYLDIAQLLKHTMGLLNEQTKLFKIILNHTFAEKPKLVYLYWQPKNWYRIEPFIEHYENIKEFQNEINPVIDFIPLSYEDFWKTTELNPLFKEHIERVKDRYNIDV